MWKTYLLYVKETKSTLPTYKEKMAQAYDFALDRMGLDIQSHGIWSDYIKFLRGVDAQGSFAENQKITALLASEMNISAISGDTKRGQLGNYVESRATRITPVGPAPSTTGALYRVR